MLSTVFVLAYACIAALSLRMTLKEYQSNRAVDRVGLVTGIMACLLWPAVAVFMLLMVNLTATPARQFKQPI